MKKGQTKDEISPHMNNKSLRLVYQTNVCPDIHSMGSKTGPNCSNHSNLTYENDLAGDGAAVRNRALLPRRPHVSAAFAEAEELKMIYAVSHTLRYLALVVQRRHASTLTCYHNFGIIQQSQTNHV